MRQFFQEPRADGNIPGPSAAVEDPRNVLDVETVDDRINDGNSTLSCKVVESLLQGPVPTEYDRPVDNLICVGGVDSTHAQQRKKDASKGDITYGSTKVFDHRGNDPVDDVRLGGIGRRQGAHDKTAGLVTKAIDDEQSTKSHPLGHFKDMVVEGKCVETLKSKTLSAGDFKKARTGPEATTPHVSAAGNFDASKSVQNFAAKNARTPGISAEVEPVENRVTYGRKVEIVPVSFHMGEARVVDGNHCNGVADSDGFVETDPKQALSRNHELASGSPSKKRGIAITQAGGELHEKGHSRNPSVESQMGSMPTTTPIVSDTKLEEGEHPGSRIPFPGGNRSPKFFSWSADGHLGPYYVAVVEQSHARRGGLALLFGLLMYAVCGWLSKEQGERR